LVTFIACQIVTGGRLYGNFRKLSGPGSPGRRGAALDARSNFEPITQSARNLHASVHFAQKRYGVSRPFDKWAGGLLKSRQRRADHKMGGNKT
jgi:hypothetical protein